MATTRTEKDSMAPLRFRSTPTTAQQTQRRRRNFQISARRFPRPFLRALGIIKKCAAQVNMDLGLLPLDLGEAVVQAAQAVADGKHDDQFVLDVFQTGSGTSTNMNANEVIAGVANEPYTPGTRGGKSPIHPNDVVNMGQSSNDVIPTALHVAALEGLSKRLIPALEALKATLDGRAHAFDPVVKLGRTHLQDAVPIRLGQEFSGYVAQVGHAIRRLRGCSVSLSELAIGGTAVGTGIEHSPRIRPPDQRGDQSRDRSGVPSGHQSLRGAGESRRGAGNLGYTENRRGESFQHREQPPMVGFRPALRHR